MDWDRLGREKRLLHQDGSLDDCSSQTADQQELTASRSERCCICGKPLGQDARTKRVYTGYQALWAHEEC